MDVKQLKQHWHFSDFRIALQSFPYLLGLCQPKEQRKTLNGPSGVDAIDDLIWLSVGAVVRVYLLHDHGECLNHPFCVELLWSPLRSKLLEQIEGKQEGVLNDIEFIISITKTPVELCGVGFEEW